MTELVAQQNWLTECLHTNPHFAKTNWLKDFRVAALEKFQARGFPARKEEAWKYTTVSQLATTAAVVPQKNSTWQGDLTAQQALTPHRLVFVNGYFSEELSQTTLLPTGVNLCALSSALTQHEAHVKPALLREFDEQRYPFAQLNSALLSDGLFLQVEKNCVLKEPIHLLFLNTAQDGFTTQPRNIIKLEKNSSVTIIEEHTAHGAENYLTNVVTEIHAAEGAQIKYYKLQDESMSAAHFANIFVHQEQNSQVRTHTFSRGSKLAREDLTVNQVATGAESNLNGYYFLHHENQHIDHHVHIDHAAPHGKSAMIYKGILDKKSQAVFNGKVHVHPNAQHINAHQANHNLLLSAQAEVNTKPELEIYADDVRCTHGATIGQLDAESLFYLRSRGVDAADAMKILTRAFAEEVFAQIDDALIREYCKNRMKNDEEL